MVSVNEVLSFPPFWNVPYPRNPYFTGREGELSKLYNILLSGKKAVLTQPQAISGLGGVGKTQTAVEFAYRYSAKYKAVLWARADSQETLNSDFENFINLLNLPIKDNKDHQIILKAIKNWFLNNENWLLILDNVEDMEMLNNFLPPVSRGHILLTTRAQATGAFTRPVAIEKMALEDGAIFLLRRAKLLAPGITEHDVLLEEVAIRDLDYAMAMQLSKALDGLPLALDQAGAYIEENGSSLTRYLKVYESQRIDLLKRRGSFTSGHPDSVSTTFDLTFRKIQLENPAAAELLCLFAFLHPDAIPEEIFTEGAAALGPVLERVIIDSIKFDEAIGKLLKYSLIRRDSETRTLSIHRLVQAVIKDNMKENERQTWVARVTEAIYMARFSKASKTTMTLRDHWIERERYSPHMQACIAAIEQYEILSANAARLFYQAAWDLQANLGNDEEIARLLLASMRMWERLQGTEDLNVAMCLEALILPYFLLRKYGEMELSFQRALAIFEQKLGKDSPDIIRIKENYTVLSGNKI
jgi:hypothetical protein